MVKLLKLKLKGTILGNYNNNYHLPYLNVTDEAEEYTVEVGEDPDDFGIQESLQRLEHRPRHRKTLLFGRFVETEVHEECNGVLEPVGYFCFQSGQIAYHTTSY